jgi:hypothetical protein
MVIGCFVGKKPSALEFEAWLVALNAELEGVAQCSVILKAKIFSAWKQTVRRLKNES